MVPNLILEDGKPAYTLREPFSMIMKARECPSGWGQLDSNQRSRKTRDLQSAENQLASAILNTYQSNIEIVAVKYVLRIVLKN